MVDNLHPSQSDKTVVEQSDADCLIESPFFSIYDRGCRLLKGNEFVSAVIKTAKHRYDNFTFDDLVTTEFIGALHARNKYFFMGKHTQKRRKLFLQIKTHIQNKKIEIERQI
jgi:hypothetical protein